MLDPPNVVNETDQLLNFIDADKNSGCGATNAEIVTTGDRTSDD